MFINNDYFKNKKQLRYIVFIKIKYNKIVRRTDLSSINSNSYYFKAIKINKKYYLA